MPVTTGMGDKNRSKSYAGINHSYSAVPQTVSEEDKVFKNDETGAGISILVDQPSFEEVESTFSRNISFRQSFRNSKPNSSFSNGNSNPVKYKSTLELFNNNDDESVIRRRSEVPGELKLNVNGAKKQIRSRSSTTTSPEPISPAEFQNSSHSVYKRATRKIGVFSKNGKSSTPIKKVEKLSSSSNSEDDDELNNSRGGAPTLDDEKLEIPVCPMDHSEGKEVLNATFPCNVDQLFSMLFFIESKFHQEFHALRKSTGIESTSWENCAEGKTKKISMTVAVVAVVGPKTTVVTETLVMLPISKPGAFYLIDSETVNQGVPYADSFYIKLHYCLSRISRNQCKLVIIDQIKYKKSVNFIAKSFIEKHGQAALEEFHTSLKKALTESCMKSNSNLSTATNSLKSRSVGESPKQQNGNLRKGPRKKRRAPIPGVKNESVGNSTHENTPSAPKSIKSFVLKGIFFLSIVFLVFLNIYFHLKINTQNFLKCN